MLLNYIEWSPSTTILEIGGFALRWYSILFGLGFVISYQIIKKRLVIEKESPIILDKMLFYSVVGAIMGARIGHCIFYDFDYFSSRPLEILLPFSFEPTFHFTGFRGLASHGGLIGILIAYYLLGRQFKKSMWWFLDKGALVGGLCLGSIRLGNLMNSEILGTATDVSWAFVFTNIDMIPRHPVQLYGFLLYTTLFLFMLWYYKRVFGKVKQGHIFGVFISILGCIRFGIEFIKQHQTLTDESLLNMGQYLSIPMILFGIILALRTRTFDKGVEAKL